MKSLVIDTNIIIYYLHGDERYYDLFNEIYQGKTKIYISVITEMELFAYEKLNPKEKKAVNKVLDTLEILPVDSRLARIAGYLRQEKKASVTDILIAATAKSLDIPLLTNNLKDFKNLKGVRVIDSVEKL